MNRKFIFLLIPVLSLFILQCGPKVKPQSELDNPQYHFTLGLRKLDAGELKDAESAFRRAAELDKKFAKTYGGLALVYAMKGNFSDADKQIRTGLYYDNKEPFLYICSGRVITMESKGKDWIEDAGDAFEKALKYDPGNEEALYYRAIAYRDALMFGKSADDFRKVISRNGEYSAKANSQWEKIQKIQRSAPGTVAGKKVALIDEIDRADLAVLFAEELGIARYIDKYGEDSFTPGYVSPEEVEKQADLSDHIVDLKGHFASSWIKEVVDLGIMDLYPGNRFLPDQKITRANYASAIQNILIGVTNNMDLATMYIGQTGGPSDVDPTHYAYNAIRLCLDRGIMKVDLKSGRFRPNDSVSGADALLIIRDLENALR